MPSVSSKIRVALLSLVVLVGGSVLTAAPAQAAASCSSLSYSYRAVSGYCKAANPSVSPYVKIGFSCWGTSIARNVQVNVGYGKSFNVDIYPKCGVFGVTGVWLIS